MINSRLRFASARGARIQTSVNIPPGIREWATGEPDFTLIRERRIHPDDAHLEYGPLSTTLHDRAIFDEVPYSPYDEMAMLWTREYTQVFGVIGCSSTDFHMFLLFAAEYLADMGLYSRE